MFDKLFGCGCGGDRKGCGLNFGSCNTSCDVLWIIILLLVVCNGGLFGLDICTLIILFIVFGGSLFGKDKCGHDHKCC